MQAMLTNKQKAETVAAQRGAAALAGVDLPARCVRLRLAPPAADGSVTIRVVGQDLRLTPPDFPAIVTFTGEPARPSDRILAIHYLLCTVPVEPTGQWISFREFAGGPFYWGPFCARAVKPLIGRIGDDLELLRKNLGRLEWQPLDLPKGVADGSGDAFLADSPLPLLAARIQALGAIDAALIYRQGDDELEPTAELLFDACARRVLCAEDASVLASRICLSLS
jgi:hypothetical protein